MFGKIVRGVFAGAILAGVALPAHAQSFPATGTIAGGAQAAAATCEKIGKEPKVIVAEQAGRIWLPIVRADDAPSCPVAYVGSSALLDAGDGSVRELVMTAGDPSAWYLQALASTVQVGVPISPTTALAPVKDGDKPTGPLVLSSVYPGGLDDFEETPVNWPEYKTGEREMRMTQRKADGNNPDIYLTVDDHALFNNRPMARGSKPLAEIDKQIEEESYEYKRKMWVFPDPGNWVPQPATVVWTATAMGAGVMVYAQVQRSGGISGGNSWLYFSPMTGPKVAE